MILAMTPCHSTARPAAASTATPPGDTGPQRQKKRRQNPPGKEAGARPGGGRQGPRAAGWLYALGQALATPHTGFMDSSACFLCLSLKMKTLPVRSQGAKAHSCRP